MQTECSGRSTTDERPRAAPRPSTDVGRLRSTQRAQQRSCRRWAVAVQRDGIAPAASAVTECDESGDTAARVTVRRGVVARRSRALRAHRSNIREYRSDRVRRGHGRHRRPAQCLARYGAAACGSCPFACRASCGDTVLAAVSRSRRKDRGECSSPRTSLIPEFVRRTWRDSGSKPGRRPSPC